MSVTKIRSSAQLYIDDNLQVNSKKIQLVADAAADSDAVNLGQLNAAVAGIGGTIHAPVADLAAAKAVAGTTNPTGHSDRMLMLIESLGLYRYDAQGTGTSNDDTIIRPTDIASDASPGRWFKISSVLTDHNNLSGKQGGTTNEYYHLTSAQLAALHAQETAATIGSLINGASAATPNDTDLVATAVSAGSLVKITWTNVKVFLKTYFDTIYTAKNGEITGATKTKITYDAKGFVTAGADATTADIADSLNKRYVTDAHLTILGNTSNTNSGNETAASIGALIGGAADATPNDSDFVATSLTAAGVLKKITWTNVKAFLKTYFDTVYAGKTARTYRATPAGTVNGSNAVFTIAANVLSGTEEVFKNGLLMNAGAGNDYTITYGATTTITFATAPSNTPFTDVILVNYSV